MSRYAASDDPLCYPGTQVLINKAGVHDQDQLDQFEQLMFLSRAEEPLPSGSLDYAHYKDIHHHFFQDVYDWAGQSRRIRTGKGGNWFCYPEYIDPHMQGLFDQLATESYLTTLKSRQSFAERAAYFVSEINAIHPFREGNGRCQLTLLSLLCDLAGFGIDEEQIDPPGFMAAMVQSFAGNTQPLVDAILRMTPEE
jgi:cell filamentation protein